EIPGVGKLDHICGPAVHIIQGVMDIGYFVAPSGRVDAIVGSGGGLMVIDRNLETEETVFLVVEQGHHVGSEILITALVRETALNRQAWIVVWKVLGLVDELEGTGRGYLVVRIESPGGDFVVLLVEIGR